MAECVLCMDIGTTSLKAGLITATGEVVSFCSVEFLNHSDIYIARRWEEYFFQAVELLSKNLQGEDETQVKVIAICVSGNGPTVVTDSGLTVLWNCQNLSSTNSSSLFISKILTLKSKYPTEYENSKYIFSGPEYFIYKLTQNAVTILPEERFSPAYWDKSLCEEYEIPFEKLPPFVPISTDCGNVKENFISTLIEKTGDKLHFISDCKVFAGGPDFVVALIGTNTLESGKICDRSGSSEGINFCVEKPIFAEGVRTLPSVISGLWNISVLIPESGSLDVSERLDKIKKAIEKLRKLAVENGISFPTKMAVTGGQAKNELLLQEKAELLNMEIVRSKILHSELLGDACAAFVGLGVYKNLQEAANEII